MLDVSRFVTHAGVVVLSRRDCVEVTVRVFRLDRLRFLLGSHRMLDTEMVALADREVSIQGHPACLVQWPKDAKIGYAGSENPATHFQQR